MADEEIAVSMRTINENLPSLLKFNKTTKNNWNLSHYSSKKSKIALVIFECIIQLLKVLESGVYLTWQKKGNKEEGEYE